MNNRQEPASTRPIAGRDAMEGQPVLFAAVVDITPPPGSPLGGYRARTGSSCEVHRPLEANVLLLNVDDRGIVVVTIDTLAISETMRLAVTQAIDASCGALVDRVIVVATHTHSAPAGWSGMILPSLPAVVDPSECRRVAQLIAAALASAHPVHDPLIGQAVGEVIGVGTDRHDPEAPVDSSTGVTILFGADRQAVCVLFDYACHATVLGPESQALSPDWVGAARATVRDSFSRDYLPVLFLPGAGGDISARFRRRERSWREADRLGVLVGEVVADAASSAPPSRLEHLNFRSEPLHACNRSALPADIAESVRSASGQGMVPESHRDEKAVSGSSLGRATVLRINDSRWIFVPFEIANNLGSLIRGGAETVRIVSCADGYLGYLADQRGHEQGRYEAEMSYFDWTQTVLILDQLRQAVMRAS